MPTMHLDQADVYYESTGTGERTLFFVHGYTCDHNDWHLQARHFSGQYRIVTIDLRGHGQSSGGKPDVTMETLAGDVNKLINKLNLKDVVLIGHSMGCRVVLEVYRQNPSPVKGIILVDGSILGTGNVKEVQETAMRTIGEIGFKEFTRQLFNGMFFGDYDVDMKNRIIERAMKLDPEFGTYLRSSFQGWDASKMENALSCVRVPLLVIQSTGVNSNSERFLLKKGDTTYWLELVKKLVLGASIEIIPGCGHFVMLEAGDTVNELIGSFTLKLK